MHIDARRLENHSLIEGDLCIVGAGAAGISIALDWINTPFKVILLEGGGFELDPAMQDLYAGKSIGQKYYSLEAVRLHYFGGTTGHWAGYCSTYDDIDFEKRDWVPRSGWPITKEDLEPYYPKAQQILELGPYEYDLAYWQKKYPELVPLPLDNQVIWNKIWQFSPPTRFNTRYRSAIVNAKNIHLYTYADATNIEADDTVRTIRQITVKNLAGKEHTVKAKYFILACCALQNARLLLASNQQAPKGLGNDHDLVGRHFMEHLEVKSGLLQLPVKSSLRLYMLNFMGLRMRAELSTTAEIQKKYQILNGTVSLSPELVASREKPMIELFPKKAAQSVEMASSFVKELRAESKSKANEKQYTSFELFTRMEQSPNPNSRVTLDTVKDALGMPRIILDWQLTEQEKRSIRQLYLILGQQIGVSGSGRVQLMEWLRKGDDYSWPDFLGGGWHHMGTTRMGENPQTGVVDQNCRVFGIDNLFMGGSSCFSTAGSANPTLTLTALVLRLSDFLKHKFLK
ncbi:MAG TPA: GMC family oxidoreductase [Chitinophagaceae bacterium]|nr:GMC family oxidoreductase [Chitinophagaceae bacterium]